MERNKTRIDWLLAAYDERRIARLAEKPLAFMSVSEILREYKY